MNRAIMACPKCNNQAIYRALRKHNKKSYTLRYYHCEHCERGLATIMINKQERFDFFQGLNRRSIEHRQRIDSFDAVCCDLRERFEGAKWVEKMLESIRQRSGISMTEIVFPSDELVEFMSGLDFEKEVK